MLNRGLNHVDGVPEKRLLRFRNENSLIETVNWITDIGGIGDRAVVVEGIASLLYKFRIYITQEYIVQKCITNFFTFFISIFILILGFHIVSRLVLFHKYLSS